MTKEGFFPVEKGQHALKKPLPVERDIGGNNFVRSDPLDAISNSLSYK